MALKRKITAEEFEGLADAIKSEYKKSGEGFVLDVSGDDDTSAKIKEFRDNNIKYRQRIEQLEADAAKFKDIDPERYAEALEAKKKFDELADKDLLKDGKLEELVSKRTDAMRQQYEKQVKTAQEQLATNAKKAEQYRNAVRTMKLDGLVRDTVTRLGAVRPGAIEDILNRARNTFSFDDEDNPTSDKFDADSNPLTIESWGKQLITQSPYLFEAAQGGGAQGGRPKGAVQGDGKVKILRNPTPKEFAANAVEIAAGKMEVVRD